MPAPLAAAPPDGSALLDAVRASGLLAPAQFTKARALVAVKGTAADTAAALVAAGLLTRFQADRLLLGRTDGFAIDSYILLEQVGRGTMSRVYKARHRTMNRPVALKVLASELTRTPADRDRYRRAVRAAGKLAHPNIVTAYDANELHDRFYFVLEFVDGPNLDALVRARGPLPAAEACEYVRQTAAGLDHAHNRGMVHCDLKPTNLLVARPTPAAPLMVKIADFGIPKAGKTGAFALPGARRGTPDPRADLYSLGCVFYFLLTGRAPGAAPIPVAQARPDVPAAVAAVVHRLLAPDPGARFASAAEVLAHLDAACVPVAFPVDDAVNFDLPAYPVSAGYDSGFLTGRTPLAGDEETSPWAQLTDKMGAGDTVPLNLDDAPAAPSYRAKPAGHGESVPLWMTASLLVGIVLLCLMGVGAVIKALGK
ncbi:MAG: serine/threonine protein kinase [Planctomycetes bacterium]|nr:serine/threonine protein kinase [Planctomycetota bacterium]